LYPAASYEDPRVTERLDTIGRRSAASDGETQKDDRD
jgi:hypothetical protein